MHFLISRVRHRHCWLTINMWTVYRHYNDKLKIRIPLNRFRPSDAYMRQQTNHKVHLSAFIGSTGTHFGEISIKIHIFSFKKMLLKMSGKYRPFCLGRNVLTRLTLTPHICDAMGLLPDTQNCGCACAGNAGNVFPVTAGKRSRHASRHVRDARAVMHAGIVN